VALTQTAKPMQRGIFVAALGLLAVLMAAAPASAQSGVRSPDEVTTRAPRPRVVIQPCRRPIAGGNKKNLLS
jgi:hypothetical protein